MGYIEDPNETCSFCAGYTVRRSENRRALADARALWAVRVLDAWEERVRQVPFRTAPDTRVFPPSRGWECAAPCEAAYGKEGYGPTPDAARLAAALAVLPSLDADVRAKLGECP